LKEIFQLYSQYYDLFYSEKNYKAEARYIDQHIKSILPNASSLLELGCGTGNHAVQLCSLGYDITGMDKSKEMIERARSKNLNSFYPLVRDITNFQLEKQFDAAIALFQVVSYLTTNDALISCFTSTFQHLRPGGIFAFDIWYSPAVLHQRPAVRTKHYEDDTIIISRKAEPVMDVNKNIVEVNFDINIRNKSNEATTSFTEKHIMRYFSLPEIELLAAQTGFTLIRAEEYLTKQIPSMESWNIFIVFQKNRDE